MNASFYRRNNFTLCLLCALLLSGCSQTGEDMMQTYLKRMTELAVIIENTQSLDSAVIAAGHIADMRDNINQLVDSIRSLPLDRQNELMQQYANDIKQTNKRISSALSELAMLDAKARRTLSDEMIKLDRL